MRVRSLGMLLIAAGAAGTVLSAACGGEDGGGLGLVPGQGPPEDLGDPVTLPGAVDSKTEIVWAGNDEIIYITPNHRDLEGVRVSDGSTRLLNTSPGRIDAVFLSPDGQWIYRVREGPGVNDYVHDRVPLAGGAAEVIASDISGLLAIAPLAAGRDLVAYAARGEKQPRGTPYIGSTKDTLYLLDMATGALTNLGFGVPLAFSPDAGELLYDEKPCDERGTYSNPCDTYTLDLSTLTRTHVPWPKSDYMKTAWWDVSGIRALVGCREGGPEVSSALCVRNLSTGTFQVIYTLIIGEELPVGGRP